MPIEEFKTRPSAEACTGKRLMAFHNMANYAEIIEELTAEVRQSRAMSPVLRESQTPSSNSQIARRRWQTAARTAIAVNAFKSMTQKSAEASAQRRSKARK
jgi:hypothetical protein